MIHASAEVAATAKIDQSAMVWHLAQVREGATVGSSSVIGRGVYIGPEVSIGSNCKIQNYALVYEPAEIEDGVFVGPGVILTNDNRPRATNPDLSLKSGHDWDPVGVHIQQGASIGAGAVLVAPITIGEWALIGAGATVVADVPPYALMIGVPAIQVGWVGRAGMRLKSVDTEQSLFRCPTTGETYGLSAAGVLERLDED